MFEFFKKLFYPTCFDCGVRSRSVCLREDPFMFELMDGRTNLAYMLCESCGRLDSENKEPFYKILETLAEEAHKGQFRRDGVTPYITHPKTVVDRVSDDAKPVAIMHDGVEDNARLREIFDAIMVLTKRPGDDYIEYIQRVKKNRLAREVKIADIEHNLSANPSAKNIEKYKMALKMLKEND